MTTWLVIVSACLLVMALGALAQPLARRREDRRHPPPGQMVEIAAGMKLHAITNGEPSREAGATVVLDAALGASSLSWARVQPALAKFARVISYDRAGFGYSSAARTPRTVAALAAELAALLEVVAAPPYILVGHSFGGLVVRQFARQHPERVAGLVLVDAAAPEQWAAPSPLDRRRLRLGARLARRGAWAARLGLARAVAWLLHHGAQPLARASAGAVSGGSLSQRPTPRHSHADLLLAPALRLPAELRPYLRRNWLRPAYYSALASMMQNLPVSAAAMLEDGGYGDRPLALLTAANADPVRAAEQQACMRLSSRCRHWTARASGHWIPIDEPELVIEAVRWVFEQIQAAR